MELIEFAAVCYIILFVLFGGVHIYIAITENEFDKLDVLKKANLENLAAWLLFIVSLFIVLR